MNIQSIHVKEINDGMEIQSDFLLYFIYFLTFLKLVRKQKRNLAQDAINRQMSYP